MKDRKYKQLRSVYHSLIDRREELISSAHRAREERNPLHPEAEIRAEADGVMDGIRETEELLNQWADEENTELPEADLEDAIDRLDEAKEILSDHDPASRESRAKDKIIIAISKLTDN